ncbi:MAG: bacterial proteasome activator family protein [Aquihabitans sp.]
MSDPQPEPTPVEVAHGELVDSPLPTGSAPAGAPDGASEPEQEERREAVEEPAKVMRIGSMIKQLLEEVRSAELDGPARARLREIYDTSVRELGSALSPDLREELERVAIPFGDGEAPSDAELRVVQAQLVGWLEGLFHGIQATVFAQQAAARHQLEDLRRQLPPGAGPPAEGGAPQAASEADMRSGTYL